MNIGGDHPVAGHFHPRVTCDLDVLANLGHKFLDLFVEICSRIDCEPAGGFVGESEESFVASHEIRLAIHFHQDTVPARRCDVLGDNAFPGFASSFGNGGRRSSLAQNIPCGAQITLGFGQRLFAIHEAGAGHLAKFTDRSGINVSHIKSLVES